MRYKNIEGVGTETSPTPIMRVVIVVLFVLASIWVQPKGGISGKKSWRARFDGIWSVAEEKWLQKRVTPVFCRNYRDSDRPK
jgi:hypothetical protein